MIERGGFSRFGRFSTLKRRPDKSQHASTTSPVIAQLSEDIKQVVYEDVFEEVPTGPKSAPALQTHCDSTCMLSLEPKLNECVPNCFACVPNM
ncbi:unnamed protein product [Echinostoma caproni]|uniref:ShKT domain-containing protein n=1 Tax=Echinostoma caproni TaxID=27848 RepID=A0A183AK20_9TREM|nr:unnamed protein product [Echinostoma caproni]